MPNSTNKSIESNPVQSNATNPVQTAKNTNQKLLKLFKTSTQKIMN
jgi:hypothetical protein